jgi:hypothetical protein
VNHSRTRSIAATYNVATILQPAAKREAVLVDTFLTTKQSQTLLNWVVGLASLLERLRSTTPFVAVEILCREQKKSACSMITLTIYQRCLTGL